MAGWKAGGLDLMWGEPGLRRLTGDGRRQSECAFLTMYADDPHCLQEENGVGLEASKSEVEEEDDMGISAALRQRMKDVEGHLGVVRTSLTSVDELA